MSAPPYRPLDALINQGRVIHGYPATRSREDALALLRREVDGGRAPSGRTLEALREANAAALDALAALLGGGEGEGEGVTAHYWRRPRAGLGAPRVTFVRREEERLPPTDLGMKVTDVIFAGSDEEREDFGRKFWAACKRARRDREEMR